MDPYLVLGVPRNADEETIKKAYRELVKKYHPDMHINDGQSEMAARKMKEINQAYDMIMNHSADASQGGSYYGNTSYGSGSADFNRVRQFINLGRTVEAITLLSTLPRTAEWYFLSGVIDMQRGWYDSAYNNIKTACDMDPGNVEYRDVLNRMHMSNTQYTSYGPSRNSDCGGSQCADCLPCLCCICPIGC